MSCQRTHGKDDDNELRIGLGDTVDFPCCRCESCLDSLALSSIVRVELLQDRTGILDGTAIGVEHSDQLVAEALHGLDINEAVEREDAP